jgi:hypothetical protein
MPPRKNNDDTQLALNLAIKEKVAEFKPRVRIPAVVIPQGNGQFLIQPGKPQIEGDEITTREFAKAANLSMSRVITLCQEGRIASRRKTDIRKSHYLIPRTELERWLAATKEER